MVITNREAGLGGDPQGVSNRGAVATRGTMATTEVMGVALRATSLKDMDSLRIRPGGMAAMVGAEVFSSSRRGEVCV